GGGLLYVIGGGTLPAYQREVAPDGAGPVEIVRFAEEVPNLLARAEAFSARLAGLTAAHGSTLEVAHVRDPWSASGVLAAGTGARLVYEANSLPSIELPDAYPAVLPATIAKIRALEERCLGAADAVVAVSSVL